MVIDILDDDCRDCTLLSTAASASASTPDSSPAADVCFCKQNIPLRPSASLPSPSDLMPSLTLSLSLASSLVLSRNHPSLFSLTQSLPPSPPLDKEAVVSDRHNPDAITSFPHTLSPHLPFALCLASRDLHLHARLSAPGVPSAPAPVLASALALFISLPLSSAECIREQIESVFKTITVCLRIPVCLSGERDEGRERGNDDDRSCDRRAAATRTGGEAGRKQKEARDAGGS